MKTCPVCSARCFDDMEVCFGCLHTFVDEPPTMHFEIPDIPAEFEPDPVSDWVVQKTLKDASACMQQSKNLDEPIGGRAPTNASELAVSSVHALAQDPSVALHAPAAARAAKHAASTENNKMRQFMAQIAIDYTNDDLVDVRITLPAAELSTAYRMMSAVPAGA